MSVRGLVSLRPAGSVLTRRMEASWLLLASVLLTIFITASLLAALASFGAQALPAAAHRQLARSPGMSIVAIGLVGAATERADTRAIHTAMDTAFGAVPYRLVEALWSDPLGFPAGRAPGIAQAEVSAPGKIKDYAALVSGSWPGPPGPGAAVPVALPAAIARQLRAGPGTLLSLRDRNNGTYVRLRVTGLYRQRDPASPYWGIDRIWTCGAQARQCSTSHGPMVVSAGAFGHGRFAVDQASWAVLPDAAAIGTGSMTALAARITRAETMLERPGRLGGLVVSTGMPAVLSRTAHALVVARSLLAIAALELLLLAGVTLGLAARLLASQRDDESVLLLARGAAGWQLARLALAEALLLGAVAAVAGAYAGARLAALLAATGPLRSAGLHLSGTPPEVAWWAVLAPLTLCAVVMVWPALRAPAPGTLRARRAWRSTAVAAGGDVAVLALALLAMWELLRSSAAAGSPGRAGIDPVLALAPALALAGISLLPVRGLPLAARSLDRLAARSRRLSAALAGWEISRRPVRQSGPVMLMVLAVASGTLALAQYQTWRRAAADQATFAAGTDVRLGALTPVPPGRAADITRAPGVTAAMAVSTVPTGDGGDVLAVGTRAAPACVLLPPGLSRLPSTGLWRLITPAGRPPGVRLPGRPVGVDILASLTPAAGPGRLGPMSATVSFQDATGAVYQEPAGVLPADGHSHHLAAVLTDTRQAIYPVRLLGLSLAYQLPAPAGPATARTASPAAAVLTVTGLAVAPSAQGRFGSPFAPGSALAAWHPAASAPGLTGPQAPPPGTALGSAPSVLAWRAGARGSQVLRFSVGQAPRARGGLAAAPPSSGVLTLAAPGPAGPIPAIATRAYLRGRHVGVGTVLSVPFGSASVPVTIVAQVRAFPTVTDAGGALIVAQAAAQEVLAAHWDAPLPVNGWWLRTAGGAVPPGLPPGLTVTSRARQTGALLGKPLLATPPLAALALVGAAALLAATGLLVGVAARLRATRMQGALLAALGVSRPSRASQLALEQFGLSVPAAGAGLLAGVGLAHLVVPALTETPDVPATLLPVLVEVPLGWAVALAGALALIPVAAAAVTASGRPRPAARLREAQLP